ncbi:MAG: hypothetical protein SV760_07175 [Halobacteria archaeon]|nr:hypothetical protein [Halobacteria archaeon]
MATENEENDGKRRLWLVERSYSEEIQNLLRLTYATRDGSEYLRKELSLSSPRQADRITAATDVSEEKLVETQDDETRERYAKEATRMAESHDPDERV